MKTTIEDRILTAGKNTQALAKNAFKRPISSLLSLCMLAGITATILSYSQTEGPQVAVQEPAQPAVTLPVARIITDTKGRTIDGTILGKSDTDITFQRKGDTKQFQINITTLSETDRAFITTLIHAPDKKTTVLFLVNYEYKFPEYAEMLKWIRADDEYTVNIGILFCADYKPEKHLEMAQIPPEEKTTTLIKSGADTDTYDILWVPKFNPHPGINGPSYFDILNHYNQSNKTIVMADSGDATRKKFFVSSDAYYGSFKTERQAMRDSRSDKEEKGFVKTDENWVFYGKNLSEESCTKLFKEVHENLSRKR